MFFVFFKAVAEISINLVVLAHIFCGVVVAFGGSIDSKLPRRL